MAHGGYTSLNNEILYNKALTAQAKILLMTFINHSTIPNYVIRKAAMMKASGLKGNTFDRYLKELKEFGLIQVHELRKGKKYEYHYTVVQIQKVNIKADKKAISHKTDEEKIVETTNCTMEEANEALMITDSNGIKKQRIPYAIGIIENKKSNLKHNKLHKNSFNSFPQRDYTKNQLNNFEKLLLQVNYTSSSKIYKK